MFNYIIFDLDNTIYDYDNANNKSLDKVFDLICNEFDILKKDIWDIYNFEKEKFQSYCYNASSHSKFIQIKKILENKKINLNKLTHYYDIYSDTFKKSMTVYPNIINFLNLCKNKSIKMYILTNNTCKEQIDRLSEMGIIEFFEKIYTSEEFGIEKPDTKLFYYLISDIGCDKNDIVKIGDNYKNDIEPLILNNIYCYWFNNNKFNITKKYLEFNDYIDLIKFYKKYYDNLNSFLDISNYIGERFDLTQAGGGNTSFKLDNLLFIKSSGCSLSSMEINKNYVGLNYKNIKNKLSSIKFNMTKKENELKSSTIVKSNIFFLKKNKPSIETTLHCLTNKYTIHIHPIQFNYISASSNCDDIINRLFQDICIIDYFTPGIDVTVELLKKYNKENIIFMKNHGLVITADSIDEIKNILSHVINTLEKELKLDYFKYHNVNYISENLKIITKQKTITYLSQSNIIYDFLKNKEQNLIDKYFKSFFPDKVVYCGIHYIYYKIDDCLTDKVNSYIKTYSEIPKIFILETNNIKYMYISSNSIFKCKEIEDVLISHLICYKDNNIFLDKNELDYLNNWDAEKYRKTINS